MISGYNWTVGGIGSDDAKISNPKSHFAVRNLCGQHDHASAVKLTSMGLQIVCCWEDPQNETAMALGRSRGIADAYAVKERLPKYGMPADSDRPVYFVAGWDVVEGNAHQIVSYLAGAMSVLGRRRIGVAGNAIVIDIARAEGFHWLWLTDQESAFHVPPGFQLMSESRRYVVATTGDYGQWNTDAQGSHVEMELFDRVEYPNDPEFNGSPGDTVEHVLAYTRRDLIALRNQHMALASSIGGMQLQMAALTNQIEETNRLLAEVSETTKPKPIDYSKMVKAMFSQKLAD